MYLKAERQAGTPAFEIARPCPLAERAGREEGRREYVK
jgi:hypothetical protein